MTSHRHQFDRRVIVESPYRGATPAEQHHHERYLSAALRDCVLHWHETPYASHGLLTREGVLRDSDEAERALGIAAGFAWREAAACTVFYVDLGWSGGMIAALNDCRDRSLPYLVRELTPTPILVGSRNAVAATGLSWTWIRRFARRHGVRLIRIGRREFVEPPALLAALRHAEAELAAEPGAAEASAEAAAAAALADIERDFAERLARRRAGPRRG